jgi:polyphosphate kinase
MLYLKFQDISMVLTFTKHQPLDQISSARPHLANEDIFRLVTREERLIHHQSLSKSPAIRSKVEQLICQAAEDPAVLAIKTTLQGTPTQPSSGTQVILNALITAAESGKQVVVLVRPGLSWRGSDRSDSRFGQQNVSQRFPTAAIASVAESTQQRLWLPALEQAGVHVVYGYTGLQRGIKMALVVRRESGKIRRYSAISFGDHGPESAFVHTKFDQSETGLLSTCELLGADLSELFNYLTGFSRQQSYRKLLLSGNNLRDRLLQLITQEIQYHHQGLPAGIVAKMQVCSDPMLIAALYQASQAGVNIDLLVQGFCRLHPGIRQLSERVRVFRLTGRNLQGDRMAYFQQGGHPQVLLGSADWCPQDLDRHFSLVLPVDQPVLVQQIHQRLQQLRHEQLTPPAAVG